MIELAPAHKIGLSLKSPLMPAAGFWGYSQNLYAPLLATESLGAIVTNPITLRPRRNRSPFSVAEVDGGIILPLELPNPGLKKIIRRNQKTWRRKLIPLIGHLSDDAPDDLARTVSALDGLAVFDGFELGLFPHTTPAEIARATQTIVHNTDLPVLVKLPFPGDPHLAEAALKAGASALVLVDAPLANAGPSLTKGRFFGGGVHAQLLPHLQAMAASFPDTPIVACGGIHTSADVQVCLQAGAVAVQLDSIFFANPLQIQQIPTYSQQTYSQQTYSQQTYSQQTYSQGENSDDPQPIP